MLLAHLPEPWLILRILAAVVIRANDRYLARLRAGRFGDYILDDIDRRLAAFRAFNPEDGREPPAPRPPSICTSPPRRSPSSRTPSSSAARGPGARGSPSRSRCLAELAEARLAPDRQGPGPGPAAADGPLRQGRASGMPKLVADPDPRLVRARRRPDGLLRPFAQLRPRRPASARPAPRSARRSRRGWTSTSRTCSTRCARDEVQDLDRIHAYLEAAAGFIGDMRGEKAAQIVRRRAAAA